MQLRNIIRVFFNIPHNRISDMKVKFYKHRLKHTSLKDPVILYLLNALKLIISNVR